MQWVVCMLKEGESLDRGTEIIVIPCTPHEYTPLLQKQSQRNTWASCREADTAHKNSELVSQNHFLNHPRKCSSSLEKQCFNCIENKTNTNKTNLCDIFWILTLFIITSSWYIVNASKIPTPLIISLLWTLVYWIKKKTNWIGGRRASVWVLTRRMLILWKSSRLWKGRVMVLQVLAELLPVRPALAHTSPVLTPVLTWDGLHVRALVLWMKGFA